MRYYDASRQRVRVMRSARLRFFLFGPFYLLSQRLWADAVLCALAVWGIVRGVIDATDAITHVSTRPTLSGALDAYAAFQNAANLGIPADQAMRDLVTALLPFYVSGFALILMMSVLTFYLPAYLDWRLRQLGYVRLVDDASEDVAVAAGG